MTIGIYKITNKVTGASYIGQSRNIRNRIYQHFNNRVETHNDYLRKAINKYGVESFSSEIVEECNKEKLDELEKKYIVLFNSIKPHGYNFEKGGCLHKELSDETKRKIGRALSMPVNQYSIDGKYLKTFSSAQEVSRKTNRLGDRSSIQLVCLGKKKTALGFQWRYFTGGTNDIIAVSGYRREKTARVSQFAKNGNHIATFGSRKEASSASGVQAKNIFYALSGGKSAGGFVWRYEDPVL